MSESLNSSVMCPCDSSLTYMQCCAPLLSREELASSAVALMRSRYTAFTLEDEAYLLSSWHPDTRPGSIPFDPKIRWLGLKIKQVSTVQPTAKLAEVEFLARYKLNGKGHRLHELSRFSRQGSAWFYLDGTQLIKPKKG